MLGVVAAMMVGAAVGVAEASTLLEVGACPNITSQADLNLLQLQGRWHHIIHFPTDEEPFVTCTQSTYNYTDGYLNVVTKGLDAGGGKVTRAGVLALLPDSGTGALQLDLDGMPPLRLWVVHTDYKRLTCLYSCSEFPGLRAEWAWALTRVSRPKVRLVARCRAKLRHLNINATKFQRIPRSATCRTT